MRLIDADAFFNDFHEMRDYEYASQEYEVDAVEVVRCKDCIYCKRFNDVWYLPKRDELLCTRCVETYHTTENDFCSMGERKEDADT